MAVTSEQRRQPDRRRVARGGRRPSDKPGFAPLILVADEDDASGAMSEMILAKLRFAVARVDSVDKAINVIGTLRPDVIVARGKDVRGCSARPGQAACHSSRSLMRSASPRRWWTRFAPPSAASKNHNISDAPADSRA